MTDTFEYRITQEMANDLLRLAKDKERRMDKEEYLIKVINESFGLLHPVTKVTTTL